MKNSIKKNCPNRKIRRNEANKQLNKKPLKLITIYNFIFVVICLTIPFAFFSALFRLSNSIMNITFIATCFYIFTHHLLAPVSKYLSISKTKNGTIEIHMRVFKLILMNVLHIESSNNRRLYATYVDFILILQLLNKQFPTQKYGVTTWLITKRNLEILKKCEFHIETVEKYDSFNEFILPFALAISHSIRCSQAKEQLHKHTIYKITWSKTESEKFLAYCEDKVNFV